MKVGIIGTGYIGLVTGASLAAMRINVVCIDSDKERIEQLMRKKSPVYEPGLDELLAQGISARKLSFTASLPSVIDSVQILFVASEAPVSESGEVDIRDVLEAARQIGTLMNTYKLVVVKSSVPVGTTIQVKEIIQRSLEERGMDIPFDVAYSPEVLIDGTAVYDFVSPDRVILGVESKQAQNRLTRLYAPISPHNTRLMFTDVPTAEMIRYATTALLATRISFMNDLAAVCGASGADFDLVRKGIYSDSRIMQERFFPGVGYGGTRFLTDTRALLYAAHEKGCDLDVLQAVDRVNDRQKRVLFDRLSAYFDGRLAGRKITLWGLAYNPQTDDVHGAASVVLARLLLAAGAKLSVYDPVAGENFARELSENTTAVEYAGDKYDALTGSDALLLLTEWTEFRAPNFKKMLKKMNTPVLFDGRNIYEWQEVEKAGFRYFNIGR